MDLGIKGKYALVTGGSHGIGLSTALALAEEGCNVAICSRNKERLEKASSRIKELGVHVVAVAADVMILADIERVMKEVIDSWGTVHILVNNVGGGGRWGSESLEETPEEVWQEVYNKNFLSAVRFSLRVIPHMRRQKWGRIVTITSLYGKEAGGRPWFNVAKTAQTALMKNLSLRKDLVREGITFNSVAPGCIMIPDTGWETEYKKDPEAFNKMVEERFPLGRLGRPEEVAAAVAFICSQKASFLNGASLLVDGGESKVF